ncbi:MAG: Unknown protein [uncultured Sulfurovum sp.]|uniref:HEAT repeat domain-containing protein n=1 Tax=uncultured Sulfurovum sp. TaxID=269237 RepID=A0A6S6UJN3_9BACT|nr:MAG: Unknown protein [uncultured Sulfurovum sp.]
MSNNKLRTVIEIVNKLRQDSTEPLSQRQSKCIEELVSLPNEYTQAIGKHAKDLLENLTIQDEDYNGYYFQVLIYTLIDRGEKEIAFLLLVQALYNTKANDNNRYVQILEEIDNSSIIPVFVDILPKLESFDEYSGHAQERIIEHLMQKDIRDAYSEVIKCLTDKADRVRATVLQFIKKYDKKEAAPAMIAVLEKEDVQYNILLILELFRKWKVQEALPLLIQHIKEDWVYEDEELLIPYQETINILNETVH